jgi:hypothetical protein
VRAWWKVMVAIVVLGVYAVAGWIAGLVVLAVAAASGIASVLRTRRALAPTAPCPWCREEVPQYGPYTCGSCHARTLGWAWRCPVCAAWSGHVACPSCGLSVPNPLLPRP